MQSPAINGDHALPHKDSGPAPHTYNVQYRTIVVHRQQISINGD